MDPQVETERWAQCEEGWISVTSVPEDESESSEKCVISEEEATLSEDWEGLEHLSPFGFVGESISLAAGEQREEQETMFKRFKHSPVSAILEGDVEQPQQPEIILVPDESGSGSPSPRVSSQDSGSDMQLPDPDESSLVITGNGVEAEYY
jgi:hypothetical protein